MYPYPKVVVLHRFSEIYSIRYILYCKHTHMFAHTCHIYQKLNYMWVYVLVHVYVHTCIPKVSLNSYPYYCICRYFQFYSPLFPFLKAYWS